MTSADVLSRRIHVKQASFSVTGAVLLSWTVPFLLLLNESVRSKVRWTLFALVLLGGAAAAAVTWFRMRRHRFLLRALTVDSQTKTGPAIDTRAMAALIDEPSRLTRNWLWAQCSLLLVFVTPLRPSPLDWITSVTVALLAALMLATASLPLLVLIRVDFLSLIERAPPAVMQELISRAERTAAARGRINRRIVAAVTMPVVFVALGSALITNAHLRRNDEHRREETARILARSALELEPGRRSGLERALQRAGELGFPVQISSPKERYGIILERDGIAELTAPLDWGSARVRFSASTVEVLSIAPVIVALLAAVGAAVAGFLLGNVLSTDLYYATRGVRLLGTNPGLGATQVGSFRRSRLRLVEELFEAIERLADRFAIFAEAQEDAIDARSAATRARGLFFASVSHDLKSPLNSILGFTHLVSLEPLTQGQSESLQAIHSRALELLALLETILDAARVEEGQLSLVSDEVPFSELYEGALSKAVQLSAGFVPQVFDEIEPNIPPLMIDRIRVQRAFATLIAYSVRSNAGGKMWIRAERESERKMRIDIDVPSPKHTPAELEAMLSTKSELGRREHRGLALGLRLARSVVQLHGGAVRVVDRGKKGAMFCVTLPTVRRPIPRSSPFHSTPPPPMPPHALGRGFASHRDPGDPSHA